MEKEEHEMYINGNTNEKTLSKEANEQLALTQEENQMTELEFKTMETNSTQKEKVVREPGCTYLQ